MKVLSINIAKPKELQVGNKTVTTGIFKEPCEGPVLLGELGLVGDSIINKKVHGGEDQAIYIYSAADYAWWSEQLGKQVTPGTFGENLTISDFHNDELKVGDRLVINESVVLEITAPRVPCVQFTTKMGDSEFAKKFIEAKRPGAYARVLKQGEIEVGNTLEWQPTDQEYISITDIFVQWHQKSWSEDIAKKTLASPISKIARRNIEERTGLMS